MVRLEDVSTSNHAQTAEAPGGRRIAAPFSGSEAGPRLRFAAYLSILALGPLLVAFWALGSYASRGELDRADAELRAIAQAGTSNFADVLDDAEARAARIARTVPVQRALMTRDVETLVRLARTNKGTSFLVGSLVAGRIEHPSAQRAVNVVVNGKRVGTVAVAVPLDEALLARLRREAPVSRGDLLIVASGDQVIAGSSGVDGLPGLTPDRPGDVRLAGSDYRALAAALPHGEPGTRLVALRTRATIEAAAAAERKGIVLAGLPMLAVVALVAYAFAPAIARGRFAVQQRALAARVLANVGDGVFLVSRAGKIAFWNRAAEAVTGLPAESVLGRRAEDAIPDWDRMAERVPGARRALEQRDSARAEMVPLEIGGRELWLLISGVTFPEGSVYTFRDVTEERRLEQAKSDFVATVSHELRTPVAAVYGATMTLRRADLALDAGRREQLLAMISEQAERLARIVDDILVTSQLSAGTLGIANEHFEALELARDVVEAAKLRLPAKLSIDVDAPNSLPAVAGDHERARQVLANLIDNAVKYSPDGGRIEVVLEARHRYVRFSVRDEGLGIHASEHQRIFEKFYRLDPDQTRGAGGTGLGLYIARELADRMNGRVSVVSEPTGGSTFALELPLAPSEGGAR